MLIMDLNASTLSFSVREVLSSVNVFMSVPQFLFYYVQCFWVYVEVFNAFELESHE